jgi:hypothetical protein
LHVFTSHVVHEASDGTVAGNNPQAVTLFVNRSEHPFTKASSTNGPPLPVTGTVYLAKRADASVRAPSHASAALPQFRLQSTRTTPRKGKRLATQESFKPA